MTQENHDRISKALDGLQEAVGPVPLLTMLALVMPHGKRGQMTVQMRYKGSDQDLAHKIYECMRHAELMPFDIRNIVMTAAAKWLGEQGDKAKEAFDRTVERCAKQWRDTQELQAVIEDCRQVIDEYEREEQEDGAAGVQTG